MSLNLLIHWVGYAFLKDYSSLSTTGEIIFLRNKIEGEKTQSTKGNTHPHDADTSLSWTAYLRNIRLHTFCSFIQSYTLIHFFFKGSLNINSDEVKQNTGSYRVDGRMAINYITIDTIDSVIFLKIDFSI